MRIGRGCQNSARDGPSRTAHKRRIIRRPSRARWPVCSPTRAATSTIRPTPAAKPSSASPSASTPNLDIAALTPEAAAAIYYHDWWQRYRYGELPGPIAVKLFDLAVNIGPDHAARCMQRALARLRPAAR